MTTVRLDARHVARVQFDTGMTKSRTGAMRGRIPLRVEPGRPGALRGQTMTVIAMTAEIGSLGPEVAAGLAARLGLTIIRFANVADNVADRLGVKPSAVLRYVSGTASLLERWRIDSRKLFHYAAEEILRLAQNGNVLIETCGATTLLRNVPGVISVRICAPVAFRVRVLMEQEGTTDANAVQARIERDDDARARTTSAFFKIEEEDARLHHVAINTERLSVETCVNTIAELTESRRLPDRPATCSALADKFVEARISSAFAEHISPSMAPLGVSVSVADGKVTLDGISCNGSLRRRAEKIARTVAGAFPIDNRIVSVPSHGRLWPSKAR
jgi:cytidylate kinase